MEIFIFYIQLSVISKGSVPHEAVSNHNSKRPIGAKGYLRAKRDAGMFVYKHNYFEISLSLGPTT